MYRDAIKKILEDVCFVYKIDLVIYDGLIEEVFNRDKNMSIKDFCIHHAKKGIPNFLNSDERDDYYRAWCNVIKIPKEVNNIWTQYLLLESQPQPAQKSKEWYEMRDKFITASAGADALGKSKYNTRLDLLKAKLGLGPPFKEGYHVHHGKKLETIATKLYEHINNVKVGEFGLLPHMSEPHVPFLSASPDGICTCVTLDGKFSNLVGRMLEIKCVTTRVINTHGPETMYIESKGQADKGIVPYVYWVQMQLQLECCNLNECDFWQCKIKNYWSKRTLLEAMEETYTRHTIEQNITRPIHPDLECGTLIQLLPCDTSNIPEDEKHEWYSKYIYPPRLDLDLEKKIEWANYMKENWKTEYPQYAENYYFDKILYYHLEQSHCYLVKRDRKWFQDNLNEFADFWKEVEYYKAHPELLDELKERKNVKPKKEKVKKFMESDSD